MPTRTVCFACQKLPAQKGLLLEMFVVHPRERSTQTLCGAWDIDHMVELLRQESQHQTEKKPRSLLDAKFVEGISWIMLVLGSNGSWEIPPQGALDLMGFL